MTSVSNIWPLKEFFSGHIWRGKMCLSRKYKKTQKNDRNFTKKYIYTLLTLFLKNKKYFQYYKQLDYLAFRGIFFPAIFAVAKCVRTQCMKKGYFDFQKGFFRPIKGLARKKFFFASKYCICFCVPNFILI